MIRDVSIGKRSSFAFGSIGAVILLLACFSILELSKLTFKLGLKFCFEGITR